MAPKLCHTAAKEIGHNKYVRFQMHVHKEISVLKDKSGEVLEVRVDIKIQTPSTNQNMCKYMDYAI